MLYNLYHNFFSIGMLTGSYVNTNFEYGPFAAEIPYGQDTIKLNRDKTFSSTFWGDGTYEINYSLSGTELSLSYSYEYGLAGFNSHFVRRFFSPPRIVLVRDMDHYMEKIKN